MSVVVHRCGERISKQTGYPGMAPRIRDPLKSLAVAIGASLILAGAQGAVVAPAPPASGSDLETLLWPTPGGQRRDQAGSVLSAARLKDRVVVVGFVTAGCTIACVVRTLDLAATARALPGSLRRRVTVLAVGLDPAGDAAPALGAFAEGLRLEPADIAVLDGDPATTAHQRAALGYPADRIEPPDTVLVFDRTGRLAMTYGGNPLDRSRLAHDLAELDRFAQGVGHPPTPGAPSSP